jgi:hypothetical protein
LTLRGVPGIERAFLNTDSKLVTLPDGSLLGKKGDPRCDEWFLDTTGTALASVLTVPGVDTKRTYSNHFIQVFEVFGIEATRSALMKELTQVLAFDGSYVNHRHLALLVDVMTSRGHLMAITRHGINRADTGALMRCSFEETVEILLEAAAVGELDDCRGISENVMLGQLAPMGTGELDVLLDPKMLETVISDNSRMGLMHGLSVKGADGGAATPYDSGSPLADGYLGTPDYNSAFSPIQAAGGATPAGFATSYSDTYNSSMSPYSSARSPSGPGYSPSSPFSTSPVSPGFSPTSPGYSPTSPLMSSASPGYSASHQHTARRHRRLYRRPLHHTLPLLRTTRRPLQTCTCRRPVPITRRRHPATLLPHPIIARLRLILLGARCLQDLDYLQPVLSTVRAVRTSLRRAPNTKEPSLLQNTLRHLLHTLLLVLNSHQRKSTPLPINTNPNKKQFPKELRLTELIPSLTCITIAYRIDPIKRIRKKKDLHTGVWGFRAFCFLHARTEI